MKVEFDKKGLVKQGLTINFNGNPHLYVKPTGYLLHSWTNYENAKQNNVNAILRFGMFKSV